MSKLNRILWSGLVLVGAACGDDVTVTPPPPPPEPGIRSVTVGPDGATVGVGGTLQMTVAVTKDPGAGAETITWTSSDNTKATVSNTGLVTGVAVGSVGIRATATVGTSSGSGVATVNIVSSTCVISGVTVTPAAASINVGQTVALAGVVNGTNCATADLGVTYTSNNTNIATVSATGVVTGIAGGTTTVLVTSTKDATKQAAMSVQVNVPAPSTISIQSVTSGGLGTPVNLSNVKGQIEIALNIDRGDKTLDHVDALIGGVVVASQTFPAVTAAASAPEASAPVTVVLSVNTMQVRRDANGLYYPVIFNGQSAITANLFVVGETTPASSNQVPVVMNNYDAEVANYALTHTSTVATEPFVDANGTSWWTGSAEFTGLNYIAFGKDLTFDLAAEDDNGTCGDADITVTGNGVTEGVEISGVYDCDGEEGLVSVGNLTYSPIQEAGIDGSTVTRPGFGGVPANPLYYTVGAQYCLTTENPCAEEDQRWNLIPASVGIPAFPDAVAIDNAGPTIIPDEIGFLATCSGTIPNPGCWIGSAYDLTADFPATDGGSGALGGNVVKVYDLVSTGPVVCGGAEISAATLAENASPTNYDACGIATDPLGNASASYEGFNVYGVDKTAPTLKFGGTFAPNNVDTIFAAIPAQTIDDSVQDNNSGLDQAQSLILTFTYLVNNGGVEANELSGVCLTPPTTLTGAGTAPQNLATLIAPDAGCGLPGYYYYSFVAQDRAGNTTDPISKKFGYEPGAPTIQAVNIHPLYGGGLPATLDVFATHTGADLYGGSMGIWYTTFPGNAVAINYSNNFFGNIFGQPWDGSLFLKTPVTGTPVTLGAQYTLGALVTDSTQAPVSAFDSMSVAVRDVYTILSPATATNVDTATTVINPSFLDATKISTDGTTWAQPGIATPVFSGSGACTFDYATPTNGPTIPTAAWVVNEAVPGVQYDALFPLQSPPALISDNGIQRLYRYTVSTQTCASLGGALKLIAVQNDPAGIPVGYLVP